MIQNVQIEIVRLLYKLFSQKNFLSHKSIKFIKLYYKSITFFKAINITCEQVPTIYYTIHNILQNYSTNTDLQLDFRLNQLIFQLIIINKYRLCFIIIKLTKFLIIIRYYQIQIGNNCICNLDIFTIFIILNT